MSRLACLALIAVVVGCFPSSAVAAGCHYFDTATVDDDPHTLVLTQLGYLAPKSSVITIYEDGQIHYYARPFGLPCHGPNCKARQPSQGGLTTATIVQSRLVQLAFSVRFLPAPDNASESLAVFDSAAPRFFAQVVFRPPKHSA